MNPNPDTWTLSVRLPRDRRLPGNFALIDPAGNTVLVGGCLGKADGQRAIQARNPDRDQARPFGDTPTGRYRPAQIAHLVPPHAVMGDYVIPMIGIEGRALAAMAERSGLYVHGGRGNDRLVPTHGCLRLLDRDMIAIDRCVGRGLISIEIREG
ncbi:MAG: L,D-transpeptidase [Ferrovibrionaceae bacterium]